MEGYDYKLISLTEIAADDTFSVRYRLGDSALERSVQKRGIVTPVIVTGGEGKEGGGRT